MSLAASPTVVLGDRFARELPEMAVSWQAEDAPEPRLLLLNEALASELGLPVDALRSPEGVRLLVGNRVPDGARPVAQAYAGHQFGGFVPRLGDARMLTDDHLHVDLGYVIAEPREAQGDIHDAKLAGDPS